MNIKTTLSITEARKNIFEIMDDIFQTSRHYTLTERGKPKAVLMSAEEFESWMETIEIMSDYKLAEELRQADRDFIMNDTVSLRSIIKNRGMGAPKKKNRYVHSSAEKKRQQKSSKNR